MVKKLLLQINLNFLLIYWELHNFQVESYGEEKYIKDQLISYNSKTLQNDKEKFVNLELNKKVKNMISKAPHSMAKQQLITLLEIGGIIKFYKQDLK